VSKINQAGPCMWRAVSAMLTVAGRHNLYRSLLAQWDAGFSCAMGAWLSRTMSIGRGPRTFGSLVSCVDGVRNQSGTRILVFLGVLSRVAERNPTSALGPTPEVENMLMPNHPGTRIPIRDDSYIAACPGCQSLRAIQGSRITSIDKSHRQNEPVSGSSLASY
jgi:hypothetical protein